MSAVNEPHPDADDPSDFFGNEEEGSLAPTPVEADSLGTPETRTPEERAEDAYQYASSHGEPLTEGMEAKHREFVAAREPSDPEKQQAQLRAIAEREAAERLAAESKVSLDGRAVDPEVAATEPEPEPPKDPADGKKSGDLSREYIVFHRVPLTVKVLEHLLKQAQDGQAPEPRVAWIEVDRADARNVNGAVGAAYNKHQKTLGKKVDLAAVSSRSFQIKHVEPKEHVETNLSIT